VGKLQCVCVVVAAKYSAESKRCRLEEQQILLALSTFASKVPKESRESGDTVASAAKECPPP